jgi:cellulose synthase/poly-beta-1,6-N-acetylglucosamine synthase-like glycosyltransferase
LNLWGGWIRVTLKLPLTSNKVTIILTVLIHFFIGFIIAYVAIYSLVHCWLFIGLISEHMREKRLDRNEPPALLVSVIVPVRNEELLLPRLLDGFKTQTWPDVEYLFIDDGSTDSSPSLLEDFKRHSGSPVRIMKSAETGIQSRNGAFENRKQEALGRAIAAARGAILLFTDADCEVGPDWVRSMIRYMSAENVGVVLGPVYKQSVKRGLLYDYQRFDHAVRGMYIAASTGAGVAGSGFGNNIAVRKKALDEAGGYASVPPSITEDAAMIALIRKKTRYNVHAVYNAATHVYTRCEPTWKKLINQTLRWHHGGLFASDLATALSFGTLALFYLLCTLCLPLAFVYPPLLIIPATVLIENILCNLPVKIYSGKSLPLNPLKFVFHSFLVEYFFTLLTILSFTAKKPEWKR